MSHSQFQSEIFILRRAWLNLWDERMTTGRINQVATFFPQCSTATLGYLWIRCNLLLQFSQAIPNLSLPNTVQWIGFHKLHFSQPHIVPLLTSSQQAIPSPIWTNPSCSSTKFTSFAISRILITSHNQQLRRPEWFHFIFHQYYYYQIVRWKNRQIPFWTNWLFVTTTHCETVSQLPPTSTRTQTTTVQIRSCTRFGNRNCLRWSSQVCEIFADHSSFRFVAANTLPTLRLLSRVNFPERDNLQNFSHQLPLALVSPCMFWFSCFELSPSYIWFGDRQIKLDIFLVFLTMTQ